MPFASLPDAQVLDPGVEKGVWRCPCRHTRKLRGFLHTCACDCLQIDRSVPIPTLEDAIALAAKAHAGQTDKAGAPYVLHLLRVMQAQESTGARMAGVLHDLVEDTGYTFEDLEDNMDVTRLDSVGAEDAERLDKYLRAHRYLGEKSRGEKPTGKGPYQ